LGVNSISTAIYLLISIELTVVNLYTCGQPEVDVPAELTPLLRSCLIIERFAREQLRAVAQATGAVEKPLPEVLFVCERNAGRSQMAACLAHKLSRGWIGVRSAGSHPTANLLDLQQPKAGSR
jgi:hypothetical protein